MYIQVLTLLTQYLLLHHLDTVPVHEVTRERRIRSTATIFVLSPVQPALHPERKSSSSSSSGSRDGGSNSYRTTHERRVSQACGASSSHQETVDRHRCQASTERCRAQSGISSRRQSSDGRRRRHVCVCHHGQQNCESRRRNGREHHVRGEVSLLYSVYCTLPGGHRVPEASLILPGGG